MAAPPAGPTWVDTHCHLDYHKYNADHGSGNYGQEYDVVASKKFGKYWTALLKYACYNGDDAPAAYTVNKFWAQVEFNF